MEGLHSLIKLLSKQKVQQIEILSEYSTMSIKSKQLYQGILEGKYLTDEDASQDIYKNSSDASAYKKLKYRLKQRLINTLFFIDIQGYSVNLYQQATYRNYKNAFAVQILLLKNLKKFGNDLAEQTIKSAIKFEQTEIVVQLVHQLLKHFGLFNLNKRKYNRYQLLLDQYQEILNAELDATKVYVKVAQLIVKSKSIKETSILEGLEEEYLKTSKRYPHVVSLKYRYYMLSTDYILKTLKKEYDSIEQICNEAIDFFGSKKEFPKFQLFDFLLKKMIVQIYFKKYNEALLLVDQCEDLNPIVANYNWYSIKSYKVFILVLQKEYDKATRTLAEVISHPKFKKLYELSRQQWLLKEAYFHFLIKAKITKVTLDDVELKTFKLSKFLNQVDLLIQDKKGFNIPVLIIEILFYLIEGKVELLENRISGLKQYNYRYLKGKNRSHYFIKMLSALPEMEYNVARVKRKVDRYYKKLLETPIELSEQEIQIEVIPYEDLWEMTMNAI